MTEVGSLCDIRKQVTFTRILNYRQNDGLHAFMRFFNLILFIFLKFCYFLQRIVNYGPVGFFRQVSGAQPGSTLLNSFAVCVT